MRPRRPRLVPLRRLLRDSRGASAVEYGLILALVVLVSFVALLAVARTTNRLWTDMDEKVRSASNQ